jgi:hypothetical protein
MKAFAQQKPQSINARLKSTARTNF